MLTCEQIAERARALSPVITQANYQAVAEAILPFVPKQRPPRQLSKAEQDAITQLPEALEEKRADLGMTTGQANAARNAFYARLEAAA